MKIQLAPNPPTLADVEALLLRTLAPINAHIRIVVMERLTLPDSERVVVVRMRLGTQKLERTYPLCNTDDMLVLPGEVYEDGCALCELVGRSFVPEDCR